MLSHSCYSFYTYVCFPCARVVGEISSTWSGALLYPHHIYFVSYLCLFVHFTYQVYMVFKMDFSDLYFVPDVLVIGCLVWTILLLSTTVSFSRICNYGYHCVICLLHSSHILYALSSNSQNWLMRKKHLVRRYNLYSCTA